MSKFNNSIEILWYFALFYSIKYLMSSWYLDKVNSDVRYWGEENYNKLLDVKMKWDPTMVFGCHHCVGDEESPRDIDRNALPYWRFDSQL